MRGRNQFAVLVENLLRLITAHPLLKQMQMLRVLSNIENRYLMGAPKTFKLMPTYFGWRGPALGGTQNQERPSGEPGGAGAAGIVLNRSNIRDALIQCGRHRLVHTFPLRTFDKIRLITVSSEQGLQVLMRNPR